MTTVPGLPTTWAKPRVPSVPSAQGASTDLAAEVPGTAGRHRATLLLAGGATLALGTLCGAFLLAGAPVPAWLVLAGRWLPALVSLALIVWMPAVHRFSGSRAAESVSGQPRTAQTETGATARRSLPGTVAHWWGLRVEGRRPLRRAIGTSALAVVMLAGVYLLSMGLAQSLGAIEAQPASTLVPALLMMMPIVLVMALSTLGEEVVWRSHLPALLAPLGFWGSALVVALGWIVFHIPLHAAYLVEGSIDRITAVTLTVALLPLSLFLSAVVARWGSVWPAVFAHALPFTAVNLAANSSGMPAESLWAVTGITAVLLISAALVIAPVNGGVTQSARAERRSPNLASRVL